VAFLAAGFLRAAVFFRVVAFLAAGFLRAVFRAAVFLRAALLVLLLLAGMAITLLILGISPIHTIEARSGAPKRGRIGASLCGYVLPKALLRWVVAFGG
jgi:hypothetical protein